MWIKVHDNFLRHPKMLKLSRLLGRSKYELAGRLLALWHWCLEYAPDGVLYNYDIDDIETAIEWDGEEGQFFSALKKYKFFDTTKKGVKIHDWYDYQGTIAERLKKRQQRAKKKQELLSESKHLTQLSRDCPSLDKIRSDKNINNTDLNKYVRSYLDNSADLDTRNEKIEIAAMTEIPMKPREEQTHIPDHTYFSMPDKKSDIKLDYFEFLEVTKKFNLGGIGKHTQRLKLMCPITMGEAVTAIHKAKAVAKGAGIGYVLTTIQNDRSVRNTPATQTIKSTSLLNEITQRTATTQDRKQRIAETTEKLSDEEREMIERLAKQELDTIPESVRCDSMLSGIVDGLIEKFAIPCTA